MPIQGAVITGEYVDILVDAQGRLIVVTAVLAPLFVDVIDRQAREVGKVQLTDFTNDGVVLPDGSILVSPAKVTMAAFDALADVAAVADAALVGLNTDHRGEGANSIEWNKLGTGVLGGVAYTSPAAIDISKYSTHAEVMAFLNIPTPVGGTITNLYIALGTDAANLFYWEIPVADIVYDAWSHYHNMMAEVDGVLGVGANLSAIQHVGIYAVTSVAGATITSILVDDVVVKRSFTTMIAQMDGDPIPVILSVGEVEEPEWLVTDKDVEFTEAIAVNAKEDENLAGLTANKIVITDVMFEGVEDLQFYLLFWSTDAFEDADLDVDSFLGFVDLDIPNNGFQVGAANQYYLNVTDLNLHYEDEDATNELHVSLLCLTAAGKQAAAAGEVKVKIGYKIRE